MGQMEYNLKKKIDNNFGTIKNKKWKKDYKTKGVVYEKSTRDIGKPIKLLRSTIIHTEYRYN